MLILLIGIPPNVFSIDATVIVAKVVAPEPPTALCLIVIVSLTAKLRPGLLIVI